MHAAGDELPAEGDGGGVKGTDGEPDERGAGGGGSEVGDEPGEDLECRGEGDVEEDGTALAKEEVERWEDDAADGEPWRRM